MAAGTAVAAVLLLGAARWPQAAVVTVTVSARCAGPNTTQVTVQLRWVLNANANSDDIEITPKETSGWPFASRNPVLGTKELPARTPRMLANARGTYKYNIALTCQSGNNPPDRVVIDPDVIVD
jgi:hypothetical protein